MINCDTVFTYEIDDMETAFQEIKKQIDDKIQLMKNSIGIVMCHHEFIHSGALKYICKNLPFDTIGVTTASQAVNDAVGELVLTIFMITSDDVIFKTGLTGSLETGVADAVKSAYLKTSEGMDENPKLALVFPPLLIQNPGDIYPDAFTQLVPNMPVFGTIAIDDSVDFAESKTVYNGESYKSAMPFVLCYGNINPRFSIATVLSKDNLMPYKSEITKTEGTHLYEINNMTAFDYFKSIGLVGSREDSNNFLFMPLIIDFKNLKDYDGVPVMRGLVMFEEDGSAVLRGNVYENSELSLSKFTENIVIESTAQRMKETNEMDNVNGILSFSCITRRMLMQTDPLAELQTIAESIDDKAPYMIGYSGGEICPTSSDSRGTTNRFHNYSLVTLII